MLKIDYFYYIIEVYQSGSISRAADNLYLSQPYLSSELKNLEKILGVCLLQRSNKGVSLTPEGEQFLEYAQKVVDIMSKIEELKNNNVGKRKISIVSMYSFTMLDLFSEFSARFENGKQNIMYEEMPNEFILDHILNSKADIGITYVVSKNLDKIKREINLKGFEFVTLVDEPLYAVINRGHILADREYITIQELKEYDFIMEKNKNPNKNSMMEQVIIPYLSEHLKLKPIHFDNNRSLLYYITKNNRSFTVGQKSLNLTNPFVKSEELRYIPIRDFDERLITGYIVSGNNKDILQYEFINNLEKFFKDYSSK